MQWGWSWKEFGGKFARTFFAAFIAAFLATLLPILDGLAGGADVSGKLPRDLLIAAVFGGIAAGVRSVIAILPIDRADNGVGLKKGAPARSSAGDAAVAAEHAAAAAKQAAKAATDATRELERVSSAVLGHLSQHDGHLPRVHGPV